MEVSNGKQSGQSMYLTCNVLTASLTHKFVARFLEIMCFRCLFPYFFPFVTFIYSWLKHNGNCDHSAFCHIYKWEHEMKYRQELGVLYVACYKIACMWILQKVKTELPHCLCWNIRVEYRTWYRYRVVISDPSSWWIRDHTWETHHSPLLPQTRDLRIKPKLLHVRLFLKETTLAGEQHLLWMHR